MMLDVRLEAFGFYSPNDYIEIESVLWHLILFLCFDSSAERGEENILYVTFNYSLDHNCHRICQRSKKKFQWGMSHKLLQARYIP